MVGRFTTAQIDMNIWTEEMLDMLVEFVKTDPAASTTGKSIGAMSMSGQEKEIRHLCSRHFD
jgi:hypothetical protein